MSRKALSLPTPDEALPGRPEPCGAGAPPRVGRAHRPAVPGGPRGGGPGLGCFWARRRPSGSCPACTRPRWATRRAHAEPDLPRGLHRAHGARGGGAGGLRPRRLSYDDCSARSGRRTTDQGMRQGNDVGRSTAPRSTFTRRRSAGAEASRDAYARALRERGFGRSPRDPRRARVLLRRGLPPAVPREEPDGYCGLAGTGVSCRGDGRTRLVPPPRRGTGGPSVV